MSYWFGLRLLYCIELGHVVRKIECVIRYEVWVVINCIGGYDLWLVYFKFSFSSAVPWLLVYLVT